MKILFCAHRIPYPPNKGDKIRSFHLIKYLSECHDIYLACLADDPGDLSYAKELESFCKTVDVVLINPQKQKVKSLFVLPTEKPLSVAYFYSEKLQQIINHRLSTMSYDAIICFSSSMAEYLFRSPFLGYRFSNRRHTHEKPATRNPQPAARNSQRATRHPRLIMDFVDVDSDKWQQYSRYTKWPFSWIYVLESRRLAAYEKRVADFFDYSVFVSRNEAELFCGQNGVQTVLTVPNGVDFTYFNPRHSSALNSSNHSGNPNDSNDSNIFYASNISSGSNASNVKSPILLFTGAMDYYANVDGVIWFAKEILPQLMEQFPSLTFYIVGRNPAPEIKALTNHNIKVIGYVEDIRPFYEMATIYVAPLRIARGIQNKILEAMAMARPIVATSKAFEGIEAYPGKDLLIADSEVGFVKKISSLLVDKDKRCLLAASARRTVEGNYSWEHRVGMLEKILTDS